MLSQVLLKRIALILSIIGAFIIIADSVFASTGPNPVVLVGAVCAILATALTAYGMLRVHEVEWLVVTALGIIAGFGLSFIVMKAFEFELFFLLIDTVAFCYAATNTPTVFGRSAIGTFAIVAIAVLVVGGTVLNGALGSYGAERAINFGIEMYLVSAALAVFAYVTGIVNSFRIQAYGWLATVILLPCIGSFMFGYFGPTALDVQQSRESALQRRLAAQRRKSEAEVRAE